MPTIAGIEVTARDIVMGVIAIVGIVGSGGGVDYLNRSKVSEAQEAEEAAVGVLKHFAQQWQAAFDQSEEQWAERVASCEARYERERRDHMECRGESP